MTINSDQQLLINQRVDPSLEQPIIHQVLRIAIYDEFHAYELYSQVIEKFGPQMPFINIVEAERRHYQLLLPLFEKYGVELPENDWDQRLTIPDSLVECREIGVSAEIDNIAMYDNLLNYTIEADVKDALFQLQAASFNNHLPAFRRCIFSHYQAQYAPQAGEASNGQSEQHGDQKQFSADDVMANAQQYQSLFQSIMSGNFDQEQLNELLQNSNMALISGLITGGLGAMILNNLNSDTANFNDSE